VVLGPSFPKKDFVVKKLATPEIQKTDFPLQDRHFQKMNLDYAKPHTNSYM